MKVIVNHQVPMKKCSLHFYKIILIYILFAGDANMTRRHIERTIPDTTCAPIDSRLQETICAHIDRRPAGLKNFFEITDKIDTHAQRSDSKFYKIHIRDCRMDEHVIQITPSTVSIHGILEITKEGNLNLLDSNFKPLDCNRSLSFKNDELESCYDEDAAMRKTHRCRGAVKFGFFAIAAVAVYTCGPAVYSLIKEDFSGFRA